MCECTLRRSGEANNQLITVGLPILIALVVAVGVVVVFCNRRRNENNITVINNEAATVIDRMKQIVHQLNGIEDFLSDNQSRFAAACNPLALILLQLFRRFY